MELQHRAGLILVATLITACTVGPDYVRPSVEVPDTFKEAAGWKLAEPRDEAPRGPWWQVYGDPALNALEEQIANANQDVQAAAARLRQARALLQGARANEFPTVTANTSINRAEGIIGSGTNRNTTATTYNLALDVSWEVDLWGRVARTVEANQATLVANTADFAAVRLSAQAALAQTYFQLRIADTQQRLLEDTVVAYQTSLRLTQNQYSFGVIPRANVLQAQTQLQTTRALAVDVGIQRATLEHAIAILIGRPPANFSLAVKIQPAALPPLPVIIPATLLERRPDIAAAERRVAAANAEIGVAQAAFFPSLTLSSGSGFRGTDISNWLTSPNRFWSVGPALASTLFDAGSRRAQTEQVIAAYDITVASYRQAVLNAFQEVEDNLSTLTLLGREASIQEQAVQAARESVRLTMNQYQAGLVNYLNVVTVQAALLSAERTSNDLLGRRLAASVTLLKALGGDWEISSTRI
ncbi:outer membrane protein, multidrug efflux system [Gammaproteobacteria bacterium]